MTKQVDTVEMLKEQDIFDVYGCDAALRGPLDSAEKFTVTERLQEIHAKYVHAAKARIRAEAQFLGVDLGDNLTFERILEKVREMLANRLSNQATSGRPVNVMQEILRAHQMSGSDMTGINMKQFGMGAPAEKAPDPSVDPDWFMKRKRGTHVFDDPKWHTIAQAYIKLETAKTNDAIVQAIDYLNTLQHNSFHMLIDLQSGRMLGNASGAIDHDKARRNVQEILDIVKFKKQPHEYADRMSKEIRVIINRTK